MTPTSTATGTPSATQPAQDPEAGAVLINEVAWAGTFASPHDEWIELHNTTAETIELSGWRLSDGGDINIHLNGHIPSHGFFLLERTDDSSVASVGADQVYTGALSNAGESLELRATGGRLIDSANRDGGGWPAGAASSRLSMERLGGEDLPGNWVSFAGLPSARDAAGSFIPGTPRAVNSAFLATPSPTPTPTSTPVAAAWPPGSVLINEVAWSGTLASASDEWIELHNTMAEAIDLAGWHLGDGGDVSIHLSGTITANGFFLLERTSDDTVASIAADGIYVGSLRNSGERLELTDRSGALVDSANASGGAWPAGDSGRRASMERWGGDDRRGNWGTFTGYYGNGLDAEGHAILGSPRNPNSLLFPTPTPTWVPGRLVINEVLIRPHFDWGGDGKETTADEFIEIYNRGPGTVKLEGWRLDDISGSGSRPWTLPNIKLEPHAHVAFFRSRTHIALNDSGDSVRLLAPDGSMVDKIHYLRVRAYNLSYGRLPDGSNELAYGLWPTPGEANLLFVEPETPRAVPHPTFACGLHERLQPRLPRLARLPASIRRLNSLGLGICVPQEIRPLGYQEPTHGKSGSLAGA